MKVATSYSNNNDGLAPRKPVQMATGYDVQRVRADFPVLSRQVYGKPLVFLDSAASSQKPQCVIDAVMQCYQEEYANIHRGVYWLSMQSTKRFDAVRGLVQKFINAREEREIVFVRGATEAINLVAYSYGRTFLKQGDEILISEMEHHANIVPWQVLRNELGLVLKIAPMNDKGELIWEEFEKLLSDRTKLVAIAHTSNALGTVNPVKDIIKLAHEKGAKVLVDGCQAVPHTKIDVQELDCDFYVFSGHKMYGPSGTGALYGKAGLLELMPPYQTGGEMIRTVTFEKTEYNVIPYRFEAGTPAIAEIIGLGVAIKYLQEIGLDNIAMHEQSLLRYGTERLSEVKGLRLIGTAEKKASILGFTLDGVHPHDIGTILDREGIAVRAGHHCAQPVMKHFNVNATVRASFGLYSTKEDVDALVKGLERVRTIFE